MAAVKHASQPLDEDFDEEEARHRFEQALRDTRRAYQERMNGKARLREGRAAMPRGEAQRGEAPGAARQKPRG